VLRLVESNIETKHEHWYHEPDNGHLLDSDVSLFHLVVSPAAQLAREDEVRKAFSENKNPLKKWDVGGDVLGYYSGIKTDKPPMLGSHQLYTESRVVFPGLRGGG